MTLSFGGGAGVLTIPGVISDGLTPGGLDVAGNVQAASASITGAVTAGSEVIAGALHAGDTSAALVPSIHELWGELQIREVPGNQQDFDEPFILYQNAPLLGNNPVSAMVVSRLGSLNGHDYSEPTLVVADTSGSTADIQQWQGSGGLKGRINQAGGLGLFGHTAPTVPRTLAQSVITAITDANAKTAVQAIANALSDMGVLTLT